MKKKVAQAEQRLISAYDFAKEKGVGNSIIYRHIHHAEKFGIAPIETVKVGKHNYIDANKYSDMIFKTRKGRKPAKS